MSIEDTIREERDYLEEASNDVRDELYWVHGHKDFFLGKREDLVERFLHIKREAELLRKRCKNPIHTIPRRNRKINRCPDCEFKNSNPL